MHGDAGRCAKDSRLRNGRVTASRSDAKELVQTLLSLNHQQRHCLLDALLRLRVRLFTMLVARQFQGIGTKTRVAPPFRFGNLQQVRLGDDVIINRDCWIVALETDDCRSTKVDIEKGARIGMGSTISAVKEVVIGEYALLARNVYIADHRHAYEDVQMPVVQQGISDINPVAIGRHSWLGQNVCILPGVQIGEHSVIGANAVVVNSIPSYSVAVGTPAKVVRQYDFQTNKWERV